jgi:predicted outer membrane repeat protein
MKYEIQGEMKKTILFFIAILFGVSVAGQLGGDGLTPGTAYYGTITDAQSWTLAYSGGTIYVGQTGNEDLTIGNGGSLSIEAGLTVKFCTTSSDLIITGTGTLTANGNSMNKITFTRNYPTINSWGHISFQSMGAAGLSSLKYCTIEWGRKDGTINTLESAGGGLQIDFNNITISNCTFQNNYAFFGGAIFVNATRSPSIDDCVFLGNTVREAGGAIYLYDGSASIISNSIFDSNNAIGNLAVYYSGGAIQFGQSISNAKVINCTFVNNSSNHPGNAIFSLSGGTLLNSIFWGSANQILFYYSTGNANYCAIQGYTPDSHFTNCFELNSSNIGTSQLPGPNFTATDGSDWSITFNSPCRDAGTAAGAPTYDILGNQRIELPDIGAYEVHYSYWNGNFGTSWTNSNNWEANVDPSSGSGDVIIPFISGSTPNYPIGTPAPDFIIGAGKTMILRSGAETTLGALINNGTLRLQEDVTGISSLICNSYSGNGADIQLYLPGGGGYPTYVWHYISSPVTTLPASVFSAVTLDLARYDESLVTSNQENGWVAYDGYVYSTGQTTGTGFSNLDVGYGYNYHYKDVHTYTINGTFNTNDVAVNVVYNSAKSAPDYPNSQGYNLLGNPFSSCLDWNQITGASGFDQSISQAIYFNKLGGYATYNNGASTNGATAIIPPMQGFFVKASKNATITFPANARVQNASQTRYKKGLDIIPLIRLKIEDQLNSDDAVVRFDEKATTGVDNAFDAYKFSKTAGAVSIWTTTFGVDFSINGLPFPDSIIVIPVSVNSTNAENLKISGTQLDGLDNYQITLTDNVSNITIDLKKTPSLSFDAPGGIVAGRFVLKVQKIVTAIPETTISAKPFNIYSSSGTVNIQTLSDIWNGKQGGIRVLDMTGRVFTTEDNVEFSKDNLLQIPVKAATGIYMVEIRSGGLRYVGKVIIR